MLLYYQYSLQGPSVAVHGVSVYCNRQHEDSNLLFCHNVSAGT